MSWPWEWEWDSRLDWDLFLELVASLPFVLGLFFIALAVVLVYVGRRLLRAAEAASYAELDDESRLAAEEERLTLVDFRGSPVLGRLRRSFARVRGLLERLQPGRRSLYQVPWFLCLGRSFGGRTTLLGQTGLSLPLGEPGDAAGTDEAGVSWWIFERGVVIDVAGDYVLPRNSRSSDQPAWLALLKLLAENRRRRPLDGVVLAIPAAELLGYDPADAEAQSALAERANVLRRKLWQAQEELGMRLPVHLLVTKCDLVPGFAAFRDRVSLAERGQIFGWSNPEAPEVPYNPGSVDTVFKSLDHALCAHQLRSLARGAETLDRDAFVAFPAALHKLREPLRIYMNQIFSASALYEPFPLRGVSFCGGQGFGVPSAASPHRLGDEDEVAVELPAANAHRRLDFVHDLMTYKVFYEWRLGRPAAARRRVLVRRKAIAQALLLAVVLLGPLALWWGTRLMMERGDNLRAHLLVPEQRRQETSAGAASGNGGSGEIVPASLRSMENGGGAVSPAARVRHAYALLAAANQVRDYRLRTPLLPASYASLYGRHATEAVARLYGETVFPATREILESQVARLTDPDVALPEPKAPTYDVLSTPEFEALESMPSRLAGVRADIDRFNCFHAVKCRSANGALLEEMRQLVQHVYRMELSPPSRRARRFYGDVLRQVSVERYSPAMHASNLRARVLGLSDRMYDRLFEENALLLDLAELERLIEELYDVGEGDPAKLYRRVLQAIERLEEDLRRPQLAWASQDELDLGDEYRAWLQALAASRFLGTERHELALEVARRGVERFPHLGRRLRRYAELDPVPLLTLENDQVLFEVPAELTALKSALEGLLDQSFMTPHDAPPLVVNPPPGSYLAWKRRPLARAVAVFESFDAFLEQATGPGGFLQKAAETAREPLESHILELVSEAEELREMPSTFTSELQEIHLLEQVVNLNEVSEPLNEIFSRLEAPPAAAMAAGCASYCASRAATAWCQLSAAVETQQRTLMRQLDELLEAEDLYSPLEEDFAGWQGSDNLTQESFGAAGEEELKAYLTRQRQRIVNLAERFAQPILTTVNTKDCWGFGAEEPFRRFKVILSDLGDYKDKKPGNALGRLEELVEEKMPALTVDNCLAEVTSTEACFTDETPDELRLSPPCDYFLHTIRGLERGLDTRCGQLVLREGREAYQRIEMAFNNRLHGKFPFSDAPSLSRVEEASPADVESFFRVFDARRRRVESQFVLVDEKGWDATVVRGMRTVMAELAQVRSFFDFFLGERAEKNDVLPVFDLQVQFRVNRDMERGGNQIIDWRFDVDGREIEEGDVEVPGRWSFGEPVRLALTWAQDGPVAPLEAREKNVRTVGRTVYFEYQNPWSLLTLMKEHKTSRENFRNYVDPHPETLLLRIPTARLVDQLTDEDGAVVVNQRSVFQTDVFVRITLLTPDGEKVEIPFPDFPTEVWPPPVR